MKKKSKDKEKILGFIGLGLDNKDEHQRITSSEHFYLVGGSKETHERMQDTAIRFSESLEKKGKRLEDTCPQEAIDMLRDSMRD